MVRQTPPACLSVVVAPSQAEVPTPQACPNVPEPSYAGFLVQVLQIGDAVDGSKLVSNSASKEVFLFPWEEASGSRVANTVEAPVSEVIPAKASCCPFNALSLIRRGFFWPEGCLF